MSQYSRLSLKEREAISRFLTAGMSLRAIALQLGRAPSSLSRECRRLGMTRRRYWATDAQKEAFTKTHLPKRPRRLAIHPRLLAYVERRLKQMWSPEQIARRIRKEYPHDMTMRISHETIYQHLYVLPRGELKKELLRYLRQSQRFRRRRILQNDDRRGKIPEMISIEERPQEVADRTVPGHWEGDLLMGPSHRSALGTLVERQTRLVLLVPLTKKDAASVREAFAKEIRRLPTQLAKTLTYDQGTEMYEHKRFTLDTKMQVTLPIPTPPGKGGPVKTQTASYGSTSPKERILPRSLLKR